MFNQNLPETRERNFSPEEDVYLREKINQFRIENFVKNAEIGNLSRLKELTEVGASTNAFDDTNFVKNAEIGNLSRLKELIEVGASVNAFDDTGSCALHRAAGAGRVNVVEFLLKNGAEVNKKDEYGKTVLHWASESGQLRVLNQLISAGVHVNQKCNEHTTALHLAAGGGYTTMVNGLIAKNAYIDPKDDQKQTPLHWAAANGHISTVEALVKKGSGVNLKDKKGKTPRSLAKIYGHKQVLSYLKEKRKEKKSPEINHANEQDFMFPPMANDVEFQNLVSRGTYESYNNRVYLAGPCNVGKSTLASLLIGENIPRKWRSTNGLMIYFGRNGIKLRERKMIPLKKSRSTTEMINTFLMGKPEVNSQQRSTFSKRKENKNNNITKDDSPVESNIEENDKERECLHEHKGQSLESKNASQNSAHMPEVRPKMSSSTISNAIPEYSVINIYNDVLHQVRNGNYKMDIALSDLVDFGGQRKFDMTHQLFVQHKGTLVLMFDASVGLHEPLKEYPQGDITAASILKHWVNSFLIYCTKSDIRMPKIVFGATHIDKIPKDKQVSIRKQLTEELTKMFSNHQHEEHIDYDRVFFIDARNRQDPEIELLKDRLVEIAFSQSSWGKRMPMAWVPLELQLSEKRAHGVKLITMQKMIELNQLNGDLALTEDELKQFLKVQQSLGRMMYFDLPVLEEFIIIEPTAMVNILKSFVTEKMFWPKDKRLQRIMMKLNDTGMIEKEDLWNLWKCSPIGDVFEDESYMNFITKVLVHMDILVEPKRYTEEEADSNCFLVPCCVNDTINSLFDNDAVLSNKTICLVYELEDTIVPSALSFKVIGAALNCWPLKKDNKQHYLFHQCAVLVIDDKNELRIRTKGNSIIAYLTNADSVCLISPDVAASIQECLTTVLTRVLQFYQQCFGNFKSQLSVSSLFHQRFGLICEKEVCLLPNSQINKSGNWTCKNKIKHEKQYVMLWTFDRVNKDCPVDCTGLDSAALLLKPTDKHCVRLASQLNIANFWEFYIHLGMTLDDWRNVEYIYDRHGGVGQMFMALHKWKGKKESQLSEATLNDLLKALVGVECSHHLCKVLREDTSLYDIASNQLQVRPSDSVLKKLTGHLGNCVLPLGIELGLGIRSVEETMYNHPNNMYEQLYCILQKWMQNTNVEPTVYRLMIALQHTDSGGLTFLREEYSAQ